MVLASGNHLSEVKTGTTPSKELLPKLSEHWEELTVHLGESAGTFQVLFIITDNVHICTGLRTYF